MSRNFEIKVFLDSGPYATHSCCRSRLIIESSYDTLYSSLNLFLGKTGNVGIGTTSPDHQLDVNGTARAEEIIVETTGADFVFQDDYDLRSLEEVEAYIQEHGRLPEIPSAEQMQAEGMQVGDMQTRLLQKIEELTLYLIEQEKRDLQHREQIRLQQEEIEQLKARVAEITPVTQR
jgi:hypothetical protein